MNNKYTKSIILFSFFLFLVVTYFFTDITPPETKLKQPITMVKSKKIIPGKETTPVKEAKKKSPPKVEATAAASEDEEADEEDDQPTYTYKPPHPGLGHVKGIYLTQWTLENTATLNYLIKHAKAAGIDTFVVDMEIPSKKYSRNIALLKQNGINYVARIIMFPDGGGKPEEITNPAIWQKKYALVQEAVNLGASSIQLDYIRYNSKQPASSEHAKNVYKIIQWYKNKLEAQNIPLQVDVFGITSLGESKHIGQNVQMFAQSVDAICPMVYPSHFVPFPAHFQHPYETVRDSLALLQKQFDNKMPIKMYAYIELSNYHYPMTHEKTLDYIKQQLKAVKTVNADGWYAWSPHNRYDNLFYILENNQTED